MSNVPAELKYTKSHEWVSPPVDGVITVGISDYAQQALGELVYVDLPEVGSQVVAGDDCCVVESVKAASDVYAPVSGEVVEVNTALGDQPGLVNEDAFGGGWLFKLRVEGESVRSDLIDADQYTAHIADGK